MALCVCMNANQVGWAPSMALVRLVQRACQDVANAAAPRHANNVRALFLSKELLVYGHAMMAGRLITPAFVSPALTKLGDAVFATMFRFVKGAKARFTSMGILVFMNAKAAGEAITMEFAFPVQSAPRDAPNAKMHPYVNSASTPFISKALHVWTNAKLVLSTM